MNYSEMTMLQKAETVVWVFLAIWLTLQIVRLIIKVVRELKKPLDDTDEDMREKHEHEWDVWADITGTPFQVKRCRYCNKIKYRKMV